MFDIIDARCNQEINPTILIEINLVLIYYWITYFLTVLYNANTVMWDPTKKKKDLNLAI